MPILALAITLLVVDVLKSKAVLPRLFLDIVKGRPIQRICAPAEVPRLQQQVLVGVIIESQAHLLGGGPVTVKTVVRVGARIGNHPGHFRGIDAFSDLNWIGRVARGPWTRIIARNLVRESLLRIDEEKGVHQ